MESLIIFIIIGLITTLFNKGAKDKQDKTMPPFDPNQKPKVEVKTLDDFAKEIFQQMNGKTTDQKVEETKTESISTEKAEEKPAQRESVTVEPIQKTVVRSNRVSQQMNGSSEVSTHPMKNQKSKKKKHLPFTSSKESLINAIIAQEVLGPPKAKQR